MSAFGHTIPSGGSNFPNAALSKWLNVKNGTSGHNPAVLTTSLSSRLALHPRVIDGRTFIADLGADSATESTYFEYKSVGSQSTSPQSVRFKPDGTTFYVGDSSGTIYQYTTVTDFLVSTSSYASKSFNTATQMALAGAQTLMRDFFIKPDGTKLYALDDDGYVYQYAFGTPWDVSTLSYESKVANVSATTGDACGSMVMSTDGTKLVVSSFGTLVLYEFTLGTSWDISTASYSGNSKSIASATCMGLSANNDGTEIYMFTGGTAGKVYGTALSSGWDLSTASDEYELFDLTAEHSSQGGMDYLVDEGVLYVTMYDTADRVYRYNITEPQRQRCGMVYNGSSSNTYARIYREGASSINANTEQTIESGKLVNVLHSKANERQMLVATTSEKIVNLQFPASGLDAADYDVSSTIAGMGSWSDTNVTLEWLDDTETYFLLASSGSNALYLGLFEMVSDVPTLLDSASVTVSGSYTGHGLAIGIDGTDIRVAGYDDTNNRAVLGEFTIDIGAETLTGGSGYNYSYLNINGMDGNSKIGCAHITGSLFVFQGVSQSTEEIYANMFSGDGGFTWIDYGYNFDLVSTIHTGLVGGHSSTNDGKYCLYDTKRPEMGGVVIANGDATNDPILNFQVSQAPLRFPTGYLYNASFATNYPHIAFCRAADYEKAWTLCCNGTNSEVAFIDATTLT